MQTALVEDLGRKGADVWMQAPRLFQEQSRSGGIVAWVPRMWSEPRLPSLPDGCPEWAARAAADLKENDVLCGLRYREHIRQAHLSGLVHEQNIDRLVKFWARPKPRGTAGYMTTGFKSFQWCGVVGHELKVWEAVFRFRHLLHTTYGEPCLGCGFPCAIQQVADDLVAVGRDPRSLS